MSKAGNTYSESWHRIANQNLYLRPTVGVRKQFYRGKKWYVLNDPFNNQFYRLRPEAYEFVSRLGKNRTVEEVWHECAELDPDATPGQEELIQLLTQLYYANLLQYNLPPDSGKLFDRYSKRRSKEIKSKLLSIMFIRIPLWDPENFLKRIQPIIKTMIGPLGILAWTSVIITASKLVADRFDAAIDQAQGILSPDNLLLLYTGLVLIKTLHELGHAFVCKRYGGEVHIMGVMLLVFTPLPFVDATSSWAFRERWKRAFVGAAGMIVEIFMAAIAAIIWSYTGEGTVHSLAYNMMFVASVSTVLFNGNPLLRFDGYYILSDVLDIPNLSIRSQQQMRHIVEKYVFGWRDSTGVSNSLKESFWLCLFGILSGIYRIVVFGGIILFIADKFLLAGLVMALICVISWIIVPVFKFVQYLSTSPRLGKTRVRAVSITVGFVFVIVFGLGIIPFPNRFRGPGVLEASEYLQVVNDSQGYVSKILTPSNKDVKEGTPLLLLTDKEIEYEITLAIAQKQETIAMIARAMQEEIADLTPLRMRLETIEKKIQDLEDQKTTLVVKARQDGIWVAPRLNEMKGAWIPRGTNIGMIINKNMFRFSAIVTQDEAANLFVDRIKSAEVRLSGQGEINHEVLNYQIIPFKHEMLPSAALGWYGGGDIAVSAKDETGRKSAEPFFQIYADLPLNDDVSYLHGRSGKIRFSMEPEPLLIQWGQKFRRLLQKRYKL